MLRQSIKNVTGIVGLLLISTAYYLFWIPQQAELQEVIWRTRAAIFIYLIGGLMIVFWLFKQQ